MKPIFILGAGGFAKEVFFLISEINRSSPIYSFAGFVDLEAGYVDIGSQRYPQLNRDEFIADYKSSEKPLVALGLADPPKMKILAERYHLAGYEFPNLIHPNVIGHWDSITMGAGNIICSGVTFEVNIEVGSFCIFNLNTTVCHDTQIGSHTVLNPRANISGGVMIEEQVLIGSSATILQNLKIGEGATVGAGAVVTKNVASGLVVVGNPARPLKKDPLFTNQKPKI